MTQQLLDQARAILGKAKDMTIATVRDDGFPQATTVSYVSDGLTIYFGCEAGSQKARNISREPKVSLTVNPDYRDWNEIEGLSMGALAERITDPEEVERMGALMLAKFPQIAELFPESEAENLAVFKVTPKVISILDYTKGFGHTDLVEL